MKFTALIPERPVANRLAALFYAVAAAGPIGSWYIGLFSATPPKLTKVEAAASFLRHVFSNENPDRWWFVLWAALPMLLLALSASHLVWHAQGKGNARLSFGLGIAIGAASPLLWPALTVLVLGALAFARMGMRDP